MDVIILILAALALFGLAAALFPHFQEKGSSDILTKEGMILPLKTRERSYM